MIARLLTRRDSTARYRVVTRVYHGWHEGRDVTPIRRLFESFATDPSFARRIATVSFLPGFQFGNELACDTARNPLYSTYRGGGQNKGQKMVDTAISCDLLHLLRFQAADIAVIVSDDDDFIPALFTAEAWNTTAILLREPGSNIDHVSSSSSNNIIAYWSDE